MLKRIHPPRADWYEELYASVMNNFTKSYEAEVSHSLGMSYERNCSKVA